MTMLTQKRKTVIGKHLYGELYGCNPRYLSDPEYIRRILVEAVKTGGFTLLDTRVWHIKPGVSGVAIILESHISIHTWPEHRFATVDVYTCGDKGDPYKSFMYIVEKLEAERYTLKFATRDYEEP